MARLTGVAELRQSARDTGRMLRIGTIVVVVLLLFIFARPLLHGAVMLLWRWPLLTWIPFLGFFAIRAGLRALFGQLTPGQPSKWPGRIAFLTMLALWIWAFVNITWLDATSAQVADHWTYTTLARLPDQTQPRILPKAGAQQYGDRNGFTQAHLTVDPGSGQLIYTAEHHPPGFGIFRRGNSDEIATESLDHVNGAIEVLHQGFHPAISQFGPNGFDWRAYNKHFFTELQDPVIVPLRSGEWVAVAPYFGYHGFPFRYPYVQGVYVMHEDGKLEDLTPAQAAARTDLDASGRLVPEKLARLVAEGYADKHGAEIEDAHGNQQPYLTNLGHRRIVWLSVSQSGSDVKHVILTDATTGKTQVWTAPPGDHLLAPKAAADLVEAQVPGPYEITRCCDSDGHSYTVRLRSAEEPRPVFRDGDMLYLVSIVPNPEEISAPVPVEKTVVIDPRTRSIVKIFDHEAEPAQADRALRHYLGVR